MTRLLFIGNSYTSRYDLPRQVAALAAAADPPVAVDTRMIVAGGASLRRHWNGSQARQAIEAAAWDFVVLQEQSTLPVKNRARYAENVRLFDALARERGARTALYLVWRRRAALDAQAKLDEAAYALATELGALVVPVGPVWQAALRERPELALYADDGSHPTPAGSYLAACTFAVALLGVQPRGDAVSERLKLDRAVAGTLEELALRHASATQAAIH